MNLDDLKRAVALMSAGDWHYTDSLRSRDGNPPYNLVSARAPLVPLGWLIVNNDHDAVCALKNAAPALIARLEAAEKVVEAVKVYRMFHAERAYVAFKEVELRYAAYEDYVRG